jgi:starch-binding outer membrane protein, SusD/RagB family
MKYISKIFLTITCLVAITVLLETSCTDILEKQPPTAISDANFWTGESDALLALVGCYRFNSSNDGFDTPQGLIYLDCAGGHGTEKENFTTLNMASINTPATSGNVLSFWGNSYTQIAHHNTFLDKIESCPMNADKKILWSAEVKSLRAYYFFYLAFHWGNVPMPLKTLTLDEANTISQTPQATVFAQVEKDLTDAIAVLPDTRIPKEFGRFTKSAARVLLSRVYLAQNKWTEAAATLKIIMDANLFQLDRRNGTSSYEKLFQIGGEYSPETIFCIQYAKDLYYTARYQYQYPECAYGGWHQFAPYNELVKAYFCTDGKDITTSAVYNENDPYMNRDQRLYATIFLPPLGTYSGTKFNTITYNCFLGSNKNDSYNRYTLFDGYGLRKGIDPSITSAIGKTYTYTPLMRYAEVLITYLEAVNEAAPGTVTQAMLDKTINDIRNRVSLPPVLLAQVSTQALLRDAIRKERRVELAFEGFRYFDVIRWGTAITELNHVFTGVKLSDVSTAPNYRGSGATASPVDPDMYYMFETRAWDSHNRYFPIPQNDLNINNNLIQNTGYN